MDNNKEKVFHKTSYSGPVEDTTWPERISGHVVDSRKHPLIHGYDVSLDLAKHYSFSETILLTLTGELPSESQSAAFETVMVFCSPVFVGDASAHTAAVARLGGATMSGILASAAACAAEEVSEYLNPQQEFISWLENPAEEHPEASHPRDKYDRARALQLTNALSSRGVELPVLKRDIGLSAAIVAVLYHCGLFEMKQMIGALVFAKTPCILAEALHWNPGRFKSYSMNIPPFAYEEHRR